ncbi:THUMP domain-containing protein 1-like [Dendronephthya gigantea]|uniref:THUMP domain-containing protein 1-like n=1 Tax=Dendronephthya gigantea TaxID=151771 RepID=UPI00106BDEAF|nr:THUMP domain-containing protein 1-like [Dendronephthya gigantea]
MRGVLVFGADNEAKAKREAYNLLNEYADELFGAEFREDFNHDVDTDTNCKDNQNKKRLVINYQHGDGEKIIEHVEDQSCSENESDENDIEKTIAKEIKEIKSLKESRRFQEIPTGVNAILFIKTTLSKKDLNKLIQCILSDIAKTGQNKTRNFQRLVPITEICAADLESINDTVLKHFLPEKDSKDCLSMCVQYKSRFNSSLIKDDVISQVSSIFLNSGHKVDLKNPDIVVIVEVMKGLCLMNTLQDFFRFKRYNLHQIANEKKNQTEVSNEEDNTKSIAKVNDNVSS